MAIARILLMLASVLLGGGSTVHAASGHDIVNAFTAPAIAYQPRGFYAGAELTPSAQQQITEELRQLHTVGFQSLVTYGSRGAMGLIPSIARAEGFTGMIIMGIWDIYSDAEWKNAVAQRDMVDGYCLGNEGLYFLRYNVDELAERMQALRDATGKPVTTGEPINSYLTGPYRDWLLTHSDWLFPNTHPYWGGQYSSQAATDWVVARADYLEATAGKPVILKETGLPSVTPHSDGEPTQQAFFETLRTSGVKFVYFEAFDQAWKYELLEQPKVEAHWGLYDRDGNPKAIIRSFDAGGSP